MERTRCGQHQKARRRWYKIHASPPYNAPYNLSTIHIRDSISATSDVMCQRCAGSSKGRWGDVLLPRETVSHLATGRVNRQAGWKNERIRRNGHCHQERDSRCRRFVRRLAVTRSGKVEVRKALRDDGDGSATGLDTLAHRARTPTTYAAVLAKRRTDWTSARTSHLPG